MQIGNFTNGEATVNSEIEMTTIPLAVVGTRCMRTDLGNSNPGILYICIALPSTVAASWVPVSQTFNSGSGTGTGSFASAGIQTTIIATATPIWFPTDGYTKVFVAPSTAAEGVQVSLGGPEVVSQVDDPIAMTASGVGLVLSVTKGFYVRRVTNNCTVTLVLGN